ncbi:Uncharacterised protein [Acetobacterium wieringae]|uniref:hypothetical protein n=1 Tax=Acetobacterium wieringae TaxID=52694 RepID=UPI001D87160E|nr:hypothetical protein [Acetobacterium wieringae]VUZ27663.1 Uncharacterised protein [Acetobacterium wieringae]
MKIIIEGTQEEIGAVVGEVKREEEITGIKNELLCQQLRLLAERSEKLNQCEIAKSIQEVSRIVDLSMAMAKIAAEMNGADDLLTV